MNTRTLNSELLHQMDGYWRAANYLSVGQIYLLNNPQLKRLLTLADVKHMLLGHWGTTPRQNFIYVHLYQMTAAYSITRAMLVAIGIASGRVVPRGNVASSDEQIPGRRS